MLNEIYLQLILAANEQKNKRTVTFHAIDRKSQFELISGGTFKSEHITHITKSQTISCNTHSAMSTTEPERKGAANEFSYILQRQVIYY